MQTFLGNRLGEVKRTLLVGLDAVCWEYLNPLVSAKRVPTLCRLIETGSWGELESTFPAHTPTAWASICTGRNPGVHGVFDMVWKQPGTYDFIPVSSEVRSGTPFWKHLNAHGYRVGLVNVPFTHPPDSIDGFVVTGFGTPSMSNDITSPPQILEWIEEQFEGYQPAVDPELIGQGDHQRILDAEKEHQRKQVLIAAELAKRNRVDVLAINLMLPDHANHYMPTMDLVEEAIVQTDADLEYLISNFRPDNVMVISDHGSRRVQGEFLLNLWLRDKGYLVQTNRPEQDQAQALNWLLMQWLDGRCRSASHERIIRGILRRTVPYLPAGFERSFWNLLETSIPSAREHFELAGEVDYTRTKVFPGSVFAGLLYLNVQGREPAGTVPKEARDWLSEKLVEELSEISDPETGQALFAKVYRSDELYSGPSLENAPDLILDTYSGRWNTSMALGRGAVAGQTRQSRYFTGNSSDYGFHSSTGMFVFSGSEFSVGYGDVTGSVLDVPATLLYLSGVPVPSNYDGSVLVETIDREFLDINPIRYQAPDRESSAAGRNPYNPVQQAELQARLRALGYIE